MVAVVTETRNVIPSFGFKTCVTLILHDFIFLSRFELEFFVHALCRPLSERT